MFHGNALVIGVHPDDIEFGAFGTLLKHRRAIKKLCYYVATLGGEGDRSNGLADRKAESEAALKMLNPDHFFWSERIGLKREDYHSEVARIEKMVIEADINLVLTMSPHDTHQDHRLMADIVMTALRRTPADLVCYGSPSMSPDFRPRLFVDVTDFMTAKMECLRCHKTQESKPYMRAEYLMAFHTDMHALLCGMKYVERFEVEELYL